MFYVQNKDKLSIGKKQVTMETDKEAKQDRQTQRKKERKTLKISLTFYCHHIMSKTGV